MTTASAQAVLDRVEADEAFGERLKDAGGAEASLALLGAEGFEVTQQEMRDAVLDRYGDVLTPEQIDAIAGGLSGEEIGVGVAIGVGVGVGAAGVGYVAAVAVAGAAV